MGKLDIFLVIVNSEESKVQEINKGQGVTNGEKAIVSATAFMVKGSEVRIAYYVEILGPTMKKLKLSQTLRERHVLTLPSPVRNECWWRVDVCLEMVVWCGLGEEGGVVEEVFSYLMLLALQCYYGKYH
ncbi:hypothetical protein SLEP1_g37082 [Rubroshorea leprosula]|uniref:Uncharacterized protein n=1 Tax=Rubroshorea leprosula TaxID=152421 RepID=A0AAV5KTH7_9ROSI|nr:hypothetical protein SLEP1_g37082 [Rubroshorea leprosula]